MHICIKNTDGFKETNLRPGPFIGEGPGAGERCHDWPSIALPYPPTPAEFPPTILKVKEIIQSAETGSFTLLTVKEAVLNALVATEVWMRFYIRKIIGK